MKDPILITGCARSGTSMVAGVVNICGAFAGNVRSANKNNEKGMFENAGIIDSVNKDYLKQIGMDPMGQYPLPKSKDLNIPKDLRQVIVSIMESQGYDGGPWMIKDAKISLLWPLYHYAFPNAKWIIVRRATSDIVNSCQRTGFMRAFEHPSVRKAINVDNTEDGWRWWVNQHLNKFIEMYQEGLDTKTVWPERLVYANYSQFQEMINWLGLQWKGQEIAEFIEPRIWHSRKRQKA